MTELFVIRHGETDFNRQHRFQGQVDVPLNANGLLQAGRLAQRLKDEPLDVLVTSSLTRARQTAEVVAEAMGTRRASAPAVLVRPSWREQGFGVLEGLDGPAIRRQYPQEWAQWLRHEADYALPGPAESNRSFHARVMQALAEVLREHAGKRVAVFTHGGVLDMLWRTVRGASLDGARAVEIPNTGINQLRWSGETPPTAEGLIAWRQQRRAKAAAAARPRSAAGDDPPLSIVRWGEADHLAGLELQSTVWKMPPELLPR